MASETYGTVYWDTKFVNATTLECGLASTDPGTVYFEDVMLSIVIGTAIGSLVRPLLE